MDIYNEKGFSDRNEYIKALAKQHHLDHGNVRAFAHILGPDKDFTDLPALGEQESIELDNAPDPYRARGYNNRADYLWKLAGELELETAIVEKKARELGPDADFTGLPKVCEEIANAPDPYIARGYDSQEAYFRSLSSAFALPYETVTEVAAGLEPPDHFDGLLAHLQEYHNDVYGEQGVQEDEYDEDMEP